VLKFLRKSHDVFHTAETVAAATSLSKEQVQSAFDTLGHFPRVKMELKDEKTEKAGFFKLFPAKVAE
jgi:hypothetical protein